MHMGGPFKTCGICGVEAMLGPLRRDRKSILRHLVFLAPTFLGSWWFFPNLGSTWCSKWSPGSCPNGSFSDQGIHSGVQEGLGCPTLLASRWFFLNLESTWCSKWTPGSCPNDSFSDQGVHSGVQEGLGCRNYFQIGLQCIHVIKTEGS